jgi:hypothetical protein
VAVAQVDVAVEAGVVSYQPSPNDAAGTASQPMCLRSETNAASSAGGRGGRGGGGRGGMKGKQ